MNARRKGPKYIVGDNTGNIRLAEGYRDFSGVKSDDFCTELLDYVRTNSGIVAIDLSGAEFRLNDVVALFRAYAIKRKQKSRFRVSGLSEKMEGLCKMAFPLWDI